MQYVSPSNLVNLTPVVHQVSAFRELNKRDTKEVWHYATNLLGNVLLFLPFPVLLYAHGVRRTSLILAAALFVSLTIELIQYGLVIGVADIDDVLLNFSGAILGVFLIRFSPVSFRAMLC
jgi:glycopeptide antibiotics resistance protein